MRTCARRLEFDAAHRVMRHESKCHNLHGHRYVVDVTCSADDLDQLGRVVDFGVIKSVFGRWVDAHLDHGTIVNHEDGALADLCRNQGWKLYTMHGNPTAENVAEELHSKASELLSPLGVDVRSVRVYETPNCWADYP